MRKMHSKNKKKTRKVQSTLRLKNRYKNPILHPKKKKNKNNLNKIAIKKTTLLTIKPEKTSNN